MPAWVFVTNIPSPYQVDFFSSLEQITPGRFHVLFSAASESDRFFQSNQPLSFPHSLLHSRPSPLRKDWHRSPELPTILNQLSPSLVILGGSYFMPDARVARHWCLQNKVSWLYWGEDPEKRRATGWRRMMKKGYLKWFLKCDAVIGIGSSATRNYAAVRSDLPHTNIPYAPDLDRFSQPSEQVQRRAKELRQGWSGGNCSSMLALFAGHFSERKAPDLLLRSFFSVSDQIANARLVMAGDGPMRATIREMAESHGLSERIHFPGFLHGEELTAAYLACDLFVLPTRHHEGWGVVVQEAMAAGLPVIVSDVVGAGHDLVAGRDTGLIFRSEDVAGLASCLSSLCHDADRRLWYGRNARKVVMSTSSAPAAQRLVQFLNAIESKHSAHG